MKLQVLAMVTVAACGGSGDDAGGLSPDASGGATIPYQSFTTKTRSIDRGFQLSTTDLIGPIACGLSTNSSAGLGTVGSQVIMRFSDLNYQTCPVGTYAVRSDCASIISGPMDVPDGCAYFRKYDQQGKFLGQAIATAGAVSVTGSEISCNFDVTLSFAGQTHHDAFTLTNWPMSWPWCK